MASLRQVRRRMRSIENIHEITKAMEMIAAFRYKRAEQRYSRSKAYLAGIERIAADLSAARGELSHPLFAQRPVKAKALVVLTADKGLCGSYNVNLIRAASAWLRENGSVRVFLVPVGKVGTEFFRKRNVPFLAAYPEKTGADLKTAAEIAQTLRAAFLSEKVDSVGVLYAAYRPGGLGRNQMIPYLGLDHLLQKKAGGAGPDYLCEPDAESVFEELLRRYLEGKIYGVLLESLTSEFGARMVAMKQATDNSEDVLDRLTLLRNKTRQAVITKELTEIVSGANAQTG